MKTSTKSATQDLPQAFQRVLWLDRRTLRTLPQLELLLPRSEQPVDPTQRRHEDPDLTVPNVEVRCECPALPIICR